MDRFPFFLFGVQWGADEPVGATNGVSQPSTVDLLDDSGIVIVLSILGIDPKKMKGL